MSGHLFRDRLRTDCAGDSELTVGSTASVDRIGRQSPSTRHTTVSPHPAASPQQRQSRSPRPLRDVSLPTNIGDHTPTHRGSITGEDKASPQMMPWPTPPALQDLLISAAAAVKGNQAVRLTSRPQMTTREKELKMKIQILEDTVAEYERQKFNVMGTFSEYRERVAERERKLEADYSSKIISLTSDVLAAKKAFEERMKEFQCVQLQDKYEREKETALEKLRQEHQQQMEELEGRCSQSQMSNLEQKYILEIQRLEEERKSLKNEKERLGDTFESKLRRAQSLYETELSASRSLYSTELEALKDHEEALKCELMARQEDYRDRIENIHIQCATSKDELARCKEEVALLEARLKQKELQVQAISRDLKTARVESDEALTKLKLRDEDLHDCRHKLTESEQALLHRSNMLSVLENAKDKLEEVIADLQLELKSLKGKVVFLENERQNLVSQSDSQVQLTESQVHALKAVLDQVTNDKEATREIFERQLEEERAKGHEREFGLRRELTRQIDELELNYSELRDDFHEKLNEEKMKMAKQQRVAMAAAAASSKDGGGSTSFADATYAALRTENESLEEEVAGLRTKLHAALNADIVNDRRLTPSRSPRRDSGESDGKNGDNAGKLRAQLEGKERALQASGQQVNDLIGKAGSLRRQLEHAQKLLNEKECLCAELEDKLKEQATRERADAAQQSAAAIISQTVEEHQLDVGGRHKKAVDAMQTKIDELTEELRKANEERAAVGEVEFACDEVIDGAGEATIEEDNTTEEIDRLRQQLAVAEGALKAQKGLAEEERVKIELEIRASMGERSTEGGEESTVAAEQKMETIKAEHETASRGQEECIAQLRGDIAEKDILIESLREQKDVPEDQGEVIGKLREDYEKQLSELRGRKDNLKARLAEMIGDGGDALEESDASGEENTATTVGGDNGTRVDYECTQYVTETTSDYASQSTVSLADTHELARILADKDEEIERLKAFLADNVKRENSSSPQSRRDSSEHTKETVSSSAQRKDQEPRMCRKAALMEKWNGIVHQLVSPRVRGAGKSSERSSSVDVTEGGKARVKTRRSSESARTSRSPSRTSTASTSRASIDKRPAWKF